QQRGISVTTSVMTFEYGDCTFNLLDTPGHEDFSEDTYRTLRALDSAVMVIDAAKGIEPQTLKLCQVCRLRDVPIMTFVNKFDREGHLTPAFFGSALQNFGVRALLDALAAHARSPRAQASETREVEPEEDKVTGFVFKVQAHMDPKHRDRVAFVRLCSGRFQR